MAASPLPSTTSAPQPTHSAANNLLDYIYSALGAKQAREREAHAMWRAAGASAGVGPSPAPSPKPKPTAAFPSRSWQGYRAAASGSSSSWQNGTREWAHHATNYSSLAVCDSNYSGLDNTLGQDPCYVSYKRIIPIRPLPTSPTQLNSTLLDEANTLVLVGRL